MSDDPINQPQEPTPQDPPRTDPAPDPAPAFDFRAHVPAEYQSDPALAEVHDVKGLVEGFVGAKRMMASRIPVPDKDATPEAWKEFDEKLSGVPGLVRLPADPGDKAAMDALYTKLGRPQTPEDYQIQRPNLDEIVPESLKGSYHYNEALEAEALTKLHELGATQQQAAGLLDWFGNVQTEALKESIAAFSQAEAALQEEWGEAFERNLGLVRRTIAEHVTTQEAALIEKTFGNNPVLNKLVLKLSEGTLEHKLVKGDGPNGPLTKPEIQTRIDEIRSHSAYRDARHPQHEALHREKARLYQALYGEDEK